MTTRALAFLQNSKRCDYIAFEASAAASEADIAASPAASLAATAAPAAAPEAAIALSDEADDASAAASLAVIIASDAMSEASVAVWSADLLEHADRASAPAAAAATRTILRMYVILEQRVGPARQIAGRKPTDAVDFGDPIIALPHLCKRCSPDIALRLGAAIARNHTPRL